MGCCVSSSATNDHNKDEVSSNNKEPPPAISVIEEETIVKEVLSETTLLTSSIENSTVESPKTKILQDEEKKPENVEIAPIPISTKSELSDLEKGSEEVSEICSLSESVQSTVNGYDEEESKQRRLQKVRQRSPAKSRNRAMVNYPTRRTDISPRKRIGEGAGSARRSNSPGTNRSRSDRRSKSPATNRSVMGPAQNYNSTVSNGLTRKKNQSPGRVRPDPNKAGSGQNQGRHNPPYTATENYDSTLNDSLENPLVSLECFIFL